MTTQESTKNCSKCNRALPRSCFSVASAAKDGLAWWCKECHIAAGRERRRKKRIEYPEWHKEELKRFRKWKASSASKIARSKYRIANRERLNEQGRCHLVVFRAVQSGKIPSVTSLTCKTCGSQASHYHHHLGYAKKHRLDVQPLCNICHKAAHVELNLAIKQRKRGAK